MLSKAKFYGEAFTLAAGPLLYGMPRVVDVSAYTTGSGNSAVFLGADTTTGSNWVGVYGSDGAKVGGGFGSATPPTGLASFSVGGASEFTWTETDGDPKAFPKPSSTSDKVAITYFNGAGTPVVLTLNFTDGQEHLVSVYRLDYDGIRTDAVTTVKDATSGTVLATSTTAATFATGVWHRFRVRGNVTITCSNSGSNEVVSGVWFDRSAGLLLPPRAKLCTGGPYYLLVNTGTNTVNLGQDTGSFLRTLPPNTVTTVLLGTTKWWAFQDVVNTAKSVADDGASVRTVPVGYVPTTSSFTAPTTYDPILCSGGFYRARFCVNGAKADIWMAEGDVTPHFVDGVAVFKFNGVCYYFKASDPQTLGHGFTLTESQVQWFTTCDLCVAPTGGGGDTTPVPCTPPVGLPTSFSVAFHAKVRFDPGPAGYGQDCIPTCEGDVTTTATGVGPNPTHWTSPTYVICTHTYGGTPITFDNPGVELYHQTLGDGTCCWELFFTDGIAACRTVFRKFTGASPVGGGWIQVDPAPWTCPSDGDTHQVCVSAGYDAITAPVVS